ncbi:MAG: S-layer homology domain-containing protein [Oscillospiraceae bacterium]|nr:S-layer homology domain-containing protein [Oscillospiraceae bacterium]
MKKLLSVIAVLTAVFILLPAMSVLPVSVAAADEEEKEIIFSDVAAADWFYDCVKIMRDKNVIGGYPDGTFLPENNAGRAEALKLIMGAAGYDVATQPEEGNWYEIFTAEALDKGLIDDAFVSDMEGYITRFEFAHLIVAALGLSVDELPASVFIDTDDSCAVILNTIGVFLGEPAGEGDSQKAFYGDRFLKRCEMAAVVLRTMRYVDKINSLLPTPDGSEPQYSAIITEDECLDLFRRLAVSNDGQVIYCTVGADAVNGRDATMSNITDMFELCMAAYEECLSSYNYLRISTLTKSGGVTYTITLTNSEGYPAAERVSEALAAAEKLYIEIWDTMPNTATQTDFAAAILDRIVLSCEYDLTYSQASGDAYSCLILNKAICGGYTSAYNMLLKRAGIKCIAVPGEATSDGTTEGHIWSFAQLDGSWLYIDSTWCDPVPDVAGRTSRTYFAVDFDSLSETHSTQYTKDRLIQCAR